MGTGKEGALSECSYRDFGNVYCDTYDGANIANTVCTPYLPDLIPDHEEMMRSGHLEDRQLFFMQCALEENCLGKSAVSLQNENYYNWHLESRRLFRFTAKITNIGNADFLPGLPKTHWEWHACHMHYHSMSVFATYDIFDVTGRRVAEGHKASFCLEDASCSENVTPVYSCKNFGDQGISPGCTDTYAYNIDCQWIDITDLEPGNYIFKVSINPELRIAEQHFDNNAVRCQFVYSGSFAYLLNCTIEDP